MTCGNRLNRYGCFHDFPWLIYAQGFLHLNQNYFLCLFDEWGSVVNSEKMLLQHTFMSCGFLSRETTWDLGISGVKRWGINRLWHVVLLRRISLQLNVFIVEPMVRLFEREILPMVFSSSSKWKHFYYHTCSNWSFAVTVQLSHSSGLLNIDTVEL